MKYLDIIYFVVVVINIFTFNTYVKFIDSFFYEMKNLIRLLVYFNSAKNLVFQSSDSFELNVNVECCCDKERQSNESMHNSISYFFSFWPIAFHLEIFGHPYWSCLMKNFPLVYRNRSKYIFQVNANVVYVFVQGSCFNKIIRLLLFVCVCMY